MDSFLLLFSYILDHNMKIAPCHDGTILNKKKCIFSNILCS